MPENASPFGIPSPLRGLRSLQLPGGDWTPAALFANGEDGVWLDPSDLSTMNTLSDQSGTTPGDGDPVGFLEDKSGNGNHATQSTAAARPTLRQTAGGLWYLDVDGVDDLLEVGNSSWFDQATVSIFASASKHDTGDDGLLGNRGNGNNGQSVTFRDSDKVNFIYPGFVVEAGNYTVNQPFVFFGQGDGSTIRAAINSETATSTSAIYTAENENLVIGRGGKRAVLSHFFGKIFGVVIVNKVCSEAERTNTEAYLAKKAGVTL